MTKFILHGGFTATKNDLNRTFYEECVKDIPEEGTALLVYFAREKDEWDTLFNQDKGKMAEATKGKTITYVCASEENFGTELKVADLVYFRGGDTGKLIRAIKEYQDFEEALAGKTVAGSSAGAYLFASYYHSASRGGVHEGLGILPIRVICHYKSSILKEKDEAVSAMKSYANDLELVILKDFEWKVFMK